MRESIKCHQCSLVNWADSETISCKRCGSPLWVKEESRFEYSSGPADKQEILSGSIKFLLGILALAVVTFLFRHLFHLIDREIAVTVAVCFGFLGLALMLVTHFWLVARIFEQSVWWGLGTLFIPIVGLIALIQFWEKVKRAFIAQIISTAIFIVGYLIGVEI